MDLVNILYNLKHQKEKGAEINKELIDFIGCCISNVPNSYSQNFQDVWAYYESGMSNLGYFVEFGATDGVVGSNTLMLEQLGWDGILCEPNPEWHDSLEKNRNVTIDKNCVYTESGKTIEFIQTEAADLSTIKGFGLDDEHSKSRENGNIIKVNTITLIDLLDNNCAPEKIEYLSIDTEGSEYEILKSFFDQNKKYEIYNISVEHNNIEDNRNNLFELLTNNGYKRKFTSVSRWDDFYSKENL